ncbi:MAG: hypothetical protein ACRDTF_08185 [Pseudonocardiaceae bacterium]
MSGGPGFSVDLGTLSSAAAGIIAVLAQLDVRHVSDINCDPMSFGHDRLAGTTKDFGDRWQTGVNSWDAHCAGAYSAPSASRSRRSPPAGCE